MQNVATEVARPQFGIARRVCPTPNGATAMGRKRLCRMEETDGQRGRMDRQATRQSGRAPIWAMALAALALSALAGLGLRNLHVDGDVIAAMAGNSPGYLAYAEFQERFALGRADEALLIRAPDLADPAAFEALENLILDLQFSEGVAEVVSLFSLPAPGSTTPLILSDPDAPLSERFATFLAAGPAATALVSADRSAALLHVIAAREAEPGDIAAALPVLADAAAPLSVTAVGQGAIERQISSALIRDQIVVTPLAVLICILAGAAILRSARAVLVCIAPAICGVLWFMGLLGWSGYALDPWLASLPTLVLVLAFADTLHLFYASREAGGLQGAIRNVLPAAFMTSLTSAIAMASFAFAGSDALVGLAIWGPIAVMCGFAAVCVLFPLMSRLLIGEGVAHPAGFALALRPARAGLRHPRAMAAATALVALALLPALNRAEPSFTFSEHIRNSSPLGQEMAYLEAEGLGSASLYVVIDDADGTPGLSEADSPRIAAVSDAVLGGRAAVPPGDVPQVPERFRAADGLAIALPVLLPLGASPDRFDAEMLRLTGALAEAGLADVTRIAGQSLMAHQVVPETVAAMRVSFYIALSAIAVVVAISQRSVLLSLMASGISALPMLAIEAVLVLSGQGMTMTAAFALTVAFGIAVDDTIHYLNRWRLAGGDRDQRLAEAMTHAGAPMVATTLLMTLGFGATVFSATASLPLFGIYVMLALWMALIADLLFLPALIRLRR